MIVLSASAIFILLLVQLLNEFTVSINLHAFTYNDWANDRSISCYLYVAFSLRNTDKMKDTLIEI